MTAPTTGEPVRRTSTLICLWVAGVAVAATGLGILSWLDAEHLFTPPRVFGSLLASGVAVCGSGFIVQLAVEQITQRLDQIDETVAAQRVTYLPQQAKQNQGVRFLPAAQAAKAQGSVGLDPASIAAAKALARRIVDGPAEARSDTE